MNKIKYSFFVGCAAPVLVGHYELSTRRVAKQLGIELVDVEDFACCGFPIKPVDHETTLLMAARNLSISKDLGLDICTICPGCASTLIEADREIMENSDLRDEVNGKLSKIDRAYDGGVEVKHFLRVLEEDVGIEKIKAGVKRNLEALKIAPHYGCHYLKPSHLFDRAEDPEFPSSLDELISSLGAKPVEYKDKMDCCGGIVLGVNEQISYTLTSRKLENVKSADVDAICLFCPMCDVMYDRNQRAIERKLNTNYNIPVLLYPQLLGLALGLSEEELGLKMNRVSTSELLGRI
ncbi:CoB--CoM heterodisulfide reductase iron-sulfur subunit B family protein [Candidatus Pacearchaeota archaeon]|nr:CoB--CoM heterodisulfide reductase iron-sulfur subunit B family protein [Candidatus Pacearchaeota archaeon]